MMVAAFYLAHKLDQYERKKYISGGASGNSRLSYTPYKTSALLFDPASNLEAIHQRFEIMLHTKIECEIFELKTT